MKPSADPNDLEMVANRITILKDLGHFDQAEELITQLSDAQISGGRCTSYGRPSDGSEQIS